MPLNTSGADAMIRIMAEDAASAKIRAIESELSGLENKVAQFARTNAQARQSTDASASGLSNFAKGAKSATSGAESFIGSVRTLATSAAAASAVVVGAGMAISKAWEFSEEGAQIERLRDTADSLAAHYGADMDYMLSALREFSQGTISNTDLILAADKAMMLGVSADADQLGQLLQIAALRGRAMGVETTKAFEDIVTGLGRMSPRILDNLGIVIDADTAYEKYAESIGKTASQLTDMEKRAALLSAVLEEGNTMLEEAGGLADDNAASYERLRASWQNYMESSKASAAGFFVGINNWLSETLDHYGDLIDTHRRYAEMFGNGGRQQVSEDQMQRGQGFDANAARYTGMGEMFSGVQEAIDGIDPTPLEDVSEAMSAMGTHTMAWIGMNLADKFDMANEAVQGLTYSTQDYFGVVMDLQAVETEYKTTIEDLAQKRAEINADQSLSDQERIEALQKISEAEGEAAAAAEEASLRVVYSILSQKLAAEGQYDAILALGEAWGFVSEGSVAASDAILAVATDSSLTAAEKKAEIEAITGQWLGLPATAQGAADETVGAVDTVKQAMDMSGEAGTSLETALMGWPEAASAARDGTTPHLSAINKILETSGASAGSIDQNLKGLPAAAQMASEGALPFMVAMQSEFNRNEQTTQDVLENLQQIEALQGSYTYVLNIIVNGSIPDLPSSNRDSDHYRCFVPGTLITLHNGSKCAIEDMRAGDVVLSMDTENGHLHFARVEYIVRHGEDEVDGYLLINDIGVTPEHPLFVNGDWKRAGDVRVGDKLLDMNARTVAVKSVEYVHKRTVVYNLHTNHETHNYFAGGILAHNKTTEGTQYAAGGQMDVAGGGWKMVGEAGFELVSPTGFVFPHNESMALMAAGLAPSDYYRTGGDMSPDERDYYRDKPRGERAPRPRRGGGGGQGDGFHRRRGNDEGAPIDGAVGESVAVIAEVAAATANMAGAVLATGQQQTQATTFQTSALTAQNDAVISELRDIRQYLSRLPTAQEQYNIARYGREASV